MALVLCFNPGSNSLKFDLIDIDARAARASQGKRLVTGTIDNIGKEASLELLRGDEKLLSKKLEAGDMGDAVDAAVDALEEARGPQLPAVSNLDLVAVRVVHGGGIYDHAVLADEKVLRDIDALKELAPLHNPNALEIISKVRERQSDAKVVVAFDTAFHQTLPERAWRYAIDKESADRHGIRKFGFHGLSHRYMLEQYAHLVGRHKQDVSVVTMHLESGSSVAAIKDGQSIDTSMGMTPLEGLMMGTRSGSIDPAIVPFLMKKAGISADEVLHILEKKSGLLGISGTSLDTRVLRKSNEASARLAMEMFAYRVRAQVGAYLAVLGSAEAIVFGGGIGENTPEVRTAVCAGLGGWGLDLDASLNETTMAGDCCVTTRDSKLAAWVLHADEGMQLAFECVKAA